MVLGSESEVWLLAHFFFLLLLEAAMAWEEKDKEHRSDPQSQSSWDLWNDYGRSLLVLFVSVLALCYLNLQTGLVPEVIWYIIKKLKLIGSCLETAREEVDLQGDALATNYIQGFLEPFNTENVSLVPSSPSPSSVSPVVKEPLKRLILIPNSCDFTRHDRELLRDGGLEETGLDAEFKIPQSEVKDRRPIRKPVMSLTSFPGAQPIALVYEFPQILQSSMGQKWNQLRDSDRQRYRRQFFRRVDDFRLQEGNRFEIICFDDRDPTFSILSCLRSYYLH